MEKIKCAAFAALLVLAACQPSGNEPWDPEDNLPPIDPEGSAPELVHSIMPYNGQKADDRGADTPGSSVNIYHENTTFAVEVGVEFKTDGPAEVTCASSSVQIHADGNYVTLDLQTRSARGVNVILTGSSTDGGLKVYSKNPVKISLNGVNITSQRGPAINLQCKKSNFIVMAEGTENVMEDATLYTDDHWYLPGADIAAEDRKGCVFAEGDIILSGYGVLKVTGRHNHGVATDKSFSLRPGATLAILDAANNGLSAKGDADSGAGIRIFGGLLYANVSAPTGKALKTEQNCSIGGGRLELFTSGDAQYVESDEDTSSGAALKVGGSLSIVGGNHLMVATGEGGKGINATGAIGITGGDVVATTAGRRYVYSAAFRTSPKAVKSDASISISGGSLSAAVFAGEDGGEALDSKASISVSGGDLYAYSYDDAIHLDGVYTQTSGRVMAYSVASDGIDAKAGASLSGGITVAYGGPTSSGLDIASVSGTFAVSGNPVVAALGGSLPVAPAGSSQAWVLAGGVNAERTSLLSLTSPSGLVMALPLPRTLAVATVFFTAPALDGAAQCTLSAGGTITSAVSALPASWPALYLTGSVADATPLFSLTPRK